MFTSFSKLALLALFLFASVPSYADGVDEYSAEMQRQMQAFTHKSSRHTGYSFGAVFRRVKAAIKVLRKSTGMLNSELDRIAKPKKRYRGTLMIPSGGGGSYGGVSVAQ